MGRAGVCLIQGLGRVEQKSAWLSAGIFIDSIMQPTLFFAPHYDLLPPRLRLQLSLIAPIRLRLWKNYCIAI